MKNVGKRMNNFDYYDLHRFANQHELPLPKHKVSVQRLHDMENQAEEEEQQRQQQQERQQHFPHNKADDDLHLKYLYSLKYNNII